MSTVPQPIGTMPVMRFQFSLATLLVCTTVLAVVCAVSVALPVRNAAMV